MKHSSGTELGDTGITTAKREWISVNISGIS